MTHPTVAELLTRSNRLGSDRKNTNYAGGNASAKGTDTDPVTGSDVELMWVKGSGGDLGTLTEPGLAVLRLDRLRALVDVYPGTEREDEMVAAFDFNSRFYADDDLIVGAADPFQLFRILFEVIRGGGYGPDSDVAFMLDQCHNIEKKIPGQIRSVLNVQEMTARALLVDADALSASQRAGDVLGANEILMDAFYTDVRPALAEWRETRGLARDPMRAYADSGYQTEIETTRIGGTQAGWGA